MKFYRQGGKDVEDEQKSGHHNTSPSNENTVRANAILKGKCYIQLMDIDRQTDVPVGAVSSTDLGQLDYNSFSVQCLSNVAQHFDINSVQHLTRYANQGQQI